MSPAAITTSAPPPTNGKKTAVISSAKPVITSSSSIRHGSAASIPPWVKPDLSSLLRVEHPDGTFASRSVSLVDLPAGAIFARISNPTPTVCAYTSVQASRDLHIDLNCDLVYTNHSCRPTLIFDMARWEVRVCPDLKEGLRAGDELTFFYPSTEWHMAQPFDCQCQEAECRGTISGAKGTSPRILKQYWLNSHIEELLEEDQAQSL
jgi:hypothetical protein